MCNLVFSSCYLVYYFVHVLLGWGISLLPQSIYYRAFTSDAYLPIGTYNLYSVFTGILIFILYSRISLYYHIITLLEKTKMIKQTINHYLNLFIIYIIIFAFLSSNLLPTLTEIFFQWIIFLLMFINFRKSHNIIYFLVIFSLF